VSQGQLKVKPKKRTQLGVGESFSDFVKPSAVLARTRRPTGAVLQERGLPPPSAVPRLTRSAASLRSLPLDPRAAFLAEQIDGVTSLQSILDLDNMPRAEAVEVLERLVELGVVVFA
jgi:hypothetical protein